MNARENKGTFEAFKFIAKYINAQIHSTRYKKKYNATLTEFLCHGFVQVYVGATQP
jgi:hypothetical protein